MLSWAKWWCGKFILSFSPIFWLISHILGVISGGKKPKVLKKGSSIGKKWIGFSLHFPENRDPSITNVTLFFEGFPYVIFFSGSQRKTLTKLRWSIVIEVKVPLLSWEVRLSIFELIPLWTGKFLITRKELFCFEKRQFGGFCNIIPPSESEYT